METALAILLALGIFVGIPAVIGFAIAGVFLRACPSKAPLKELAQPVSLS